MANALDPKAATNDMKKVRKALALLVEYDTQWPKNRFDRLWFSKDDPPMCAFGFYLSNKFID